MEGSQGSDESDMSDPSDLSGPRHPVPDPIFQENIPTFIRDFLLK